MKKIRKTWVTLLLSALGFCLVLTVYSAISYKQLTQHSTVTEILSETDKIRLAESLHLRHELGEAVWQGWGRADIPVILYNEEYAFLIGYPNPPDGWVKIPLGVDRGSAWELVPNDSFMEQPYYRQRLSDPEISPEAFTVLVGDRWVSSFQTQEWFKISLTNQIRADMPSFLQPVFPYSIFIGLLAGNTDKYILLSAHESFHAYQGMLAPLKLANAELITHEASDYPWDDQKLQADWQTELDLMAEALRSTDQTRTLEQVRQFLTLRDSRRESASLSPEMIAYEQHREWLEGLGRYAELEIWRQASVSNYLPIPEANNLSDFESYSNFDRRWEQELDQISRMAEDEGDGRFYYSGMSQAFLLDRLSPNWKQHVFEEGVWLENLLEAEIQATR